jgi:hypothetical protein
VSDFNDWMFLVIMGLNVCNIVNLLHMIVRDPMKWKQRERRRARYARLMEERKVNDQTTVS